MIATPRLRRTSAGGSPLLALLHDAALRLPARLPLAPHELPVALSKIVAAEEVRLDLEDRSAALLRVEAVQVAARVWRTVKLGERDNWKTHSRSLNGSGQATGNKYSNVGGAACALMEMKVKSAAVSVRIF